MVKGDLGSFNAAQALVQIADLLLKLMHVDIAACSVSRPYCEDRLHPANRDSSLCTAAWIHICMIRTRLGVNRATDSK